MRATIGALLFLIIGSAYAQNAQIVEVSKADAAEAHAAWITYQKALSDWTEIKTRLDQKYGTTADPKASNGTVTIGGYERAGFSCGVEYSKDFLFAVPAKCSEPSSRYGYCCANWNNLLTAGSTTGTMLNLVPVGIDRPQ